MPRSVRHTVLLVLLVGFALLTVTQYCVTGGLFVRQLREVEARDAFDRLARLHNATEMLLADLDGTTADWAHWDDTYEFVHGHRPDYIADNLTVETFQSLRLSLLIIVDAQEQPIYARVWSGDDGLQPAPADIVATALSTNKRGSAEKLSGFIATSQGIMLLSSRQVRDTPLLRTSRGRLIMGRSLTTFLPALGRLTTGKVAVEPTAAARHPQNQSQPALIRASGGDTLLISDTHIDGHTPLTDLWGRPIATWHMQMEQSLTTPLTNSRWYFLLSTLAVGGVFCIAVVIVIQSRLVKPVERLVHSVAAIGSEGSRQTRVDEQHQVTEFVSLARSINAMLLQTEMQQQMRIDRDTAIEANRLKTEFLATMSHEIRTPMNGVLGMSELLLRTDLNPRQRHLADTVLRSARSLLDILNDTLDFSKIEAGKVQLECAPFSPAELIDGVVAPFITAAHAKGVALVTHVDAAVPQLVIGDALRLRQIVSNLVANALKFTAKGSVTVHCEVDDFSLHHVSLHLTVTDTGIGIPPAAQQRVFEPFTQADSKTTRQYGGTGLGLAIVARLVALMGGTIGLHSESGAGSRFWFTVPLQRSAAKALPVGEPHIATGAGYALSRSPTVLLAEDHDVNREVLTEMLQVFGCKVTAVENGAAALAAASNACFDVLLMDCQMPIMDGQTATAQLRALEHSKGTARTFIVALTADATAANKQRCYQAGMDLVITKPVSQARLREVVMRAMQAPRNFAA
jgi:signal transduction histidine kinase/sensor domain CHASE-containing protein